MYISYCIPRQVKGSLEDSSASRALWTELSESFRGGMAWAGINVNCINPHCPLHLCYSCSPWRWAISCTVTQVRVASFSWSLSTGNWSRLWEKSIPSGHLHRRWTGSTDCKVADWPHQTVWLKWGGFQVPEWKVQDLWSMWSEWKLVFHFIVTLVHAKGFQGNVVQVY